MNLDQSRDHDVMDLDRSCDYDLIGPDQEPLVIRNDNDESDDGVLWCDDQSSG